MATAHNGISGVGTRDFVSCLLAGSLMFFPLAAWAQEALHDIATIDVSTFATPAAPSDEGDSVKFFYLAKDGASFREAYDDLADCYRFLEAGPPLHLPGYAPWTEVARRKEDGYDPARSSFSVGQMAFEAAFLPMIDAVISRNLANTKLRRCMATRGYRRFAVTKDIWMQIHQGTVREALLRQAKLASTLQSAHPGIRP